MQLRSRALLRDTSTLSTSNLPVTSQLSSEINCRLSNFLRIRRSHYSYPSHQGRRHPQASCLPRLLLRLWFKRLSTYLENCVGHVIDVDDLAIGGIAKQATKPVRRPTNEKLCVRTGMGVSTGSHMSPNKWDPVASSALVCKHWVWQSLDS